MVCLEQPVSSMMPHHPRLQAIISHTTWFRALDVLGFFRADSPKAVSIWSNKKVIGSIRAQRRRTTLPVSKGVVVKGTSKLGKSTVSGGKGLKATQSYPVDFGRGIAYIYMSNEASIRAEAMQAWSDNLDTDKIDLRALLAERPSDEWLDAELQSTFNALAYMAGCDALWCSAAH
eukprot:6313043-Alexandrium_andersonii.AAC.1